MHKTHEEYRESLVLGTIETVAEIGIENITTRTVCKKADLSEVYIYRYFLDKNDLLRKAFVFADRGLAEMVEKEFYASDFSTGEVSEKIEALLKILWNSFVNNKNKALFYYYYYYSIQMLQTRDTHYEIWGKFLEGMSNQFPKVKAMCRLTDVLLETIMNYAAKVHFGIAENSDEVCKFLFDLIMPTVMAILCPEE